MNDSKLQIILAAKNATTQAFKTVHSQMSTLTAAATNLTVTFGALAGTAGFAGLVRSGAIFEKSMDTVSGVMRSTEEQTAMLTAAAKEMGETTEWSARESAEALLYMGMAGYSAAKSIESLPGILNLATAGGMELGMAADIVTDSMTAMGMEANELTRFNDVLVGTITRSNTNIQMLGESLKYAAPIAATFGYEIETVSALLGTLANAGIKASDAGTDLRQAMVRNKEAAYALGTAHDDLIGTLYAARDAGWGVSEVVDHYGMIASKSVLVLMRQLEAFEKLEGELHNVQGEAAALAKIKLDNLTGDFKILTSTIEGIGLAAYENIQGDLRGGVQSLTEYMRSNRQEMIDFVEGMKDMVVSMARFGELVSSLLSNTLTGWNNLPPVIQDIGLIGALVGGAKARAALLFLTYAIGKAKEFSEITAKAADEHSFAAQLEMQVRRYNQVKEKLEGLRGDDVAVFTPIYEKQMDEIQARIDQIRQKMEEKIAIQGGIDLPFAASYEEEKKKVEEKSKRDPFKIKYTWDAPGAHDAHVQAFINQQKDIRDRIAANWDEDIDYGMSADVYGNYAEEVKQYLYESTEAMDAHVIAYQEQMKGLEDLTERTAWAMQESFSSVFIDGLKGELDSFSDYFDVVLNSMIDAWGNYMGQMVTQGMFGKDMKGGGWADTAMSWVGNLIGARQYHSGGKVGRDGVARSVSPGVFVGAPRLHNGLRPDEIPAILQKGETVIPKGAGGGSLQIIVNEAVNSPEQGVTTEVMERGEGEAIIINLVKKQVSNPSSPIGKALTQTYGLGKMLRRS